MCPAYHNDISLDRVHTLYSLFLERVSLSQSRCAYLQYQPVQNEWEKYSWQQIAQAVARWQAGFAQSKLAAGDRVAVMLPNSVAWVVFDQAALGSGLVSVPIYNHDNAGNIAYILKDSGSRLLVSNAHQLERLPQAALAQLDYVVSVDKVPSHLAHCTTLKDWCGEQTVPRADTLSGDDLATIIYTSGTTGPPKGVMLTHANLLSNAAAAAQTVAIGNDDLFLSFLPLSHSFERTAGYYMTMLSGATVAFARSLQQLKEDMQHLKPTVLISVPRLYEQVYDKLLASLAQRSLLTRVLFRIALYLGWAGRSGRWTLLRKIIVPLFANRLQQVFGGRMRFAISGGAPLAPALAKLFGALGPTVYQGYGLTEAGPVVSVNFPEVIPNSIGQPLANVAVKIGDNKELLVRSPSVMRGYWNKPEASAQAIDAEGWLHTGDQARLDRQGNLYLIGRIKEIIVLSNGEKIAPADLEQVLSRSPLFQQTMIYGEGRAFLIVVLMPNEEALVDYLRKHKLPTDKLATTEVQAKLVRYINRLLKDFPAYAKVRRVVWADEPWSVENGLLTPTLKLKRRAIVQSVNEQIEHAYERF